MQQIKMIILDTGVVRKNLTSRPPTGIKIDLLLAVLFVHDNWWLCEGTLLRTTLNVN